MGDRERCFQIGNTIFEMILEPDADDNEGALLLKTTVGA